MKRILIPIGIALLLVPAIARTLWFYGGVYSRPEPVKTPDFLSLTVPQPPEGSTASPSASLPASRTSADVDTVVSPVVLFDMTHTNIYTLAEVEPLTRALTSLGGRVLVSDPNQTLANQLKPASAYVVIAPSYTFLAEEVTAVKRFVENGGRVLVIADPTRNSTSYYYGEYTLPTRPVDVANLLLSPFNLSFSDDYLYNLLENEGNFRNVFLSDIASSTLTKGLDQVIFYGTHSLASAGSPLISGDEKTYSSLTDDGGRYAVAGLAENERVLAIGDMTFMTTSFARVADNQQLISNVAAFLINDQRSHGLVDFPFIFTRPVQYLVKEGQALDSSSVGALNRAQALLSGWTGSVEVASEPQNGYDLLVTGTYKEAQDELADLLAGFKLEFEQGSGGEPAPDLDLFDFYPTPTPVDSLPDQPFPTPTPVDPLLPDQPTPTPLTPPVGDQASFGLTPTATPYYEPFGDYNFGGGSSETDEEWQGTVSVPGFGSVKSNGVGLVLFEPAGERNTLILLASSSQALAELISLLSIDGLNSCAIQGQAAACPLSTGGFSSFIGY